MVNEESEYRISYCWIIEDCIKNHQEEYKINSINKIKEYKIKVELLQTLCLLGMVRIIRQVLAEKNCRVP